MFAIVRLPTTLRASALIGSANLNRQNRPYARMPVKRNWSVRGTVALGLGPPARAPSASPSEPPDRGQSVSQFASHSRQTACLINRFRQVPGGLILCAQIKAPLASAYNLTRRPKCSSFLGSDNCEVSRPAMRAICWQLLQRIARNKTQWCDCD